jgi:hypothetical protein
MYVCMYVCMCVQEEADYLADAIMIMHGGHVRAFGDPLFLKQSYGKGYQVNLTVTEAHSAETQHLIASVLPDATCVVDETASSLSVTVPRNNLRGLPRLFTWLESSSRAALIVKEWGISNTTLEQVFLMLCDMNTEINNISSLQKESNHRELCPMCRVNMKSTVFVRNLEGRILIVPDSVCWDCINKNDSFMVTEDQVAFALEDGATAQEKMVGMLAVAQGRAEAVTTQQMLALENSELNEVLDTFHDEHEPVPPPASVLEDLDTVLLKQQAPPDTSDQPLKSHLEIEAEGKAEAEGEGEGELIQNIQHAASPRAESAGGAAHDNRADGAALSQVKAIFVKNIVLQSKQCCSNCCAVFFVAFMFLMLYVMSLLFKSAENITVCDDGYLTELDCSHSTLVDHIFSGSRNNMVEDYWETGLDDDSVGPYGYTIKYYMVPSTQYSGDIEIFGDSNENYYNYGFPETADNRSPVIWASMSQSAELQHASDSLGLEFSSRSIPEEGSTSGDAPNAYMYANQQAVAISVDLSRDDESPRCYDYAEDLVVNTTSFDSALQNFSDSFADTVFYCEKCKLSSELVNDNDTGIFFDGTVWCSESVTYCGEDSCEAYPYAFMNYFVQGETMPGWEYLGSLCPTGVRQLSLNSLNEYTSSTFRAMSYLNLLSNSLLHPTLQSFDIQGGISAYGDLNFDAQLISQNLANVLSVIAMMLLNGFWPLAVWRLAHERSNNIVLMVHTSGMRKLAYMAGMFLFDMTISILSGVAMVAFAVLLKLSRFDGAPVGYLVAIVIFSAVALNGGAQLMVIVSRKKASVLPLLAPCLMVASVVTSSLLNILVYPNDGDWKWPLSLYPFLAQGRGLYIVLVYHRGTPEVDLSIVLMALFGVVSLALSFVLELENEIRLEAKKWLASVTSVKSCTDHIDPAVKPDLSGLDVERGELLQQSDVDPDVTREAERALAYTPPQDGRQDGMAIIVQNMRLVFPNGFQAVQDLSLALEYGECFGLLGPNGAGESASSFCLSVLCALSCCSVLLLLAEHFI